MEGLDKKPHIVVATPGRLLDLVEENQLSLGKLCTVPGFWIKVQRQIATVLGLMIETAVGCSLELYKEGTLTSRARVCQNISLRRTPKCDLPHNAQWDFPFNVLYGFAGGYRSFVGIEH